MSCTAVSDGAYLNHGPPNRIRTRSDSDLAFSSGQHLRSVAEEGGTDVWLVSTAAAFWRFSRLRLEQDFQIDPLADVERFEKRMSRLTKGGAVKNSARHQAMIDGVEVPLPSGSSATAADG